MHSVYRHGARVLPPATEAQRSRGAGVAISPKTVAAAPAFTRSPTGPGWSTLRPKLASCAWVERGDRGDQEQPADHDSSDRYHRPLRNGKQKASTHEVRSAHLQVGSGVERCRCTSWMDQPRSPDREFQPNLPL